MQGYSRIYFFAKKTLREKRMRVGYTIKLKSLIVSKIVSEHFWGSVKESPEGFGERE